VNEPELVVGELRGYRWWKLGPEGWLLSPWRGKQRWQPGANQGLDCDCGFYALHEVPRLRDHPARFGWEIGVETSGARYHGLVFGIAGACGRVLVGTDGWRAELASPLALLWGEEVDLDRRFDGIEARYHLPTYRQLPSLLQEWGPDEVERDLSSAA
jgi:hypothetical protein